MIALMLAAAATTPLSGFGDLVGSCWRADFSPTVRDTHCFEAIYGGAHVRDRHEVTDKGKTVYAGETVYSLDGGATVFIYFNSLGGVGRGSVTSEGAKMRFVGAMRASPDKPEQRIDSEWSGVGPEGYEARSLVGDASTAGNSALRFTKVK